MIMVVVVGHGPVALSCRSFEFRLSTPTRLAAIAAPIAVTQPVKTPPIDLFNSLSVPGLAAD
jgi:hypothetical protein